MNTKEVNYYKPIPGSYKPKNILIIRFHAIGDIAITFPYCNALKKLFPDSNIDFLTEEQNKDLPLSLQTFGKVYEIPLLYNDSNPVLANVKKYKNAFEIALELKKNKYDIVLDLQRNKVSRFIRKKIDPKYYGEFDRFSPLPAGTRTLNTFINTGLNISPVFILDIKSNHLLNAKNILLQNGWDGTKKLFLLNPAGAWITRNWPIDNYIKLAQLISYKFNACFLLLGNDKMLEKSKYIFSCLPGIIINLANKTSISEAFSILQYVTAVISDDSGLMHMAWVSGNPTIAILGSSRADWTTPLGNHIICLNSSDLECGNCMSPECKYNDVHCLTRYSPEFVYEKLIQLLGG